MPPVLTRQPVGSGSSSGLLAARPAANTVTAGYIYFATDDNGGTAYRSDGASWSKMGAGVLETGGRELGSAQITSNSLVTGTTRGPGTNPLTLSAVSVAARPVALIFDAAALQVSADQGVGLLYFSRSPAGAGTWTDIGYMHAIVSATTGRVPAHRELRQSLAAGSYDFKVEMVTGNAAHTVTIPASPEGAGQPGPASLTLVER